MPEGRRLLFGSALLLTIAVLATPSLTWLLGIAISVSPARISLRNASRDRGELMLS